MLLVGSIVMGVCMIVVGIIVAKFSHDWPGHVAAGWTAVALIWVYIAGFGATWGPVSWTLVSEIFPLSIRAKGASIGKQMTCCRHDAHATPATNPNLNRRFVKLAQQFRYRFLCSSHVEVMALGHIYLLQRLSCWRYSVGVVLPSRDEECHFGRDGSRVQESGG